MFEKFLDKFNNIWEAMFFVFFSIFIGFIMVMIIDYTFSTKKFDGYYLHHDRDGYYSIYINWNNAPDEVAYKTFDGKEALRVLKELQANSKLK